VTLISTVVGKRYPGCPCLPSWSPVRARPLHQIASSRLPLLRIGSRCRCLGFASPAVLPIFTLPGDPGHSLASDQMQADSGFTRAHLTQ